MRRILPQCCCCGVLVGTRAQTHLAWPGLSFRNWIPIQLLPSPDPRPCAQLLSWTITPFEQAALTYLPGTRGWRKRAGITLLVGLGAVGGVLCGVVLAALACLAPQVRRGVGKLGFQRLGWAVGRMGGSMHVWLNAWWCVAACARGEGHGR